MPSTLFQATAHARQNTMTFFSLPLVKIAVAIALVLSACVAVEMTWRIYGLGLVLDSEQRFPPPSAEDVSTKAAPLLRAATNAEPIYAIVQIQHVALVQQHEFIVDVAESSRTSAEIGLACSVGMFGLLTFAHVGLDRFSRKKPSMPKSE